MGYMIVYYSTPVYIEVGVHVTGLFDTWGTHSLLFDKQGAHSSGVRDKKMDLVRVWYTKQTKNDLLKAVSCPSAFLKMSPLAFQSPEELFMMRLLALHPEASSGSRYNTQVDPHRRGSMHRSFST